MSRLAFLILMAVFALPLAADDAARASALVGNLASDEWAVRERASRELIGMGEAARPALRAVLEHDDPEVRVRAGNALIAIGEEFGFAMECATSESEHLQSYGRSALSNLFRIDDSRNLRELTSAELQIRWRGYNDRQQSLMGPPHIAMARLQALSGVRILIADDARGGWARVMRAPVANVSVMGGIDQIALVRDALNEALRANLASAPADEQLVARPMRIGRSNLLFVTRRNASTGVTRRCGEQLIADLLREGPESARAAMLLAEATGTDVRAADRLRAQFAAQPTVERMMWLVLALGVDDALRRTIAATDTTAAASLLASRDWMAIELAARFLDCLPPDARGTALARIIESSDDSLELMCALWIARGCPLPDAARARVTRLLSSKDGVLAGAAARWFAGAEAVSDDDLGLIWKAAEFQPIESEFFTAALELVSRPDVSERLVENARRSFTGLFETQQALAAAVLTGRASAEDLAVALDKLNGARAKPRLARSFARLFDGCSELPEDSRKKFIERLFSSDVSVRRVYMQALRQCHAGFRLDLASTALNQFDGSKQQHEQLARVAMLGVMAGSGDAGALDRIYRVLEGDDMELAKAAGAAHTDALEGEELFDTLERLSNQQGITFAAAAALEGYMEICRRSIAMGDRVTFRRAYGIAIGMPLVNQNWQLGREVQNLLSMIGAEAATDKEQPLLPRDPALKQVDVKIP